MPAPSTAGHVHERWHVGVDVWDFRPVAESTLAAIIANAISQVARAPHG
jgi:hypothetical protein